MGRSSAYWKSNLYLSEDTEPDPAAPLTDLAPPLAARFRMVREGLLKLPGVGEQVRFMGPTWHWAWEYGLGNRKVCWLHLMKNSVDVTFTLSDSDESRLTKGTKVAGIIARALVEGQRTGPVKWCWPIAGPSMPFSISRGEKWNGWLNGRHPGVRRASMAGKEERLPKPTESVGLRCWSGCAMKWPHYTSARICPRRGQGLPQQ
jgi:hypothetical protein